MVTSVRLKPPTSVTNTQNRTRPASAAAEPEKAPADSSFEPGPARLRLSDGTAPALGGPLSPDVLKVSASAAFRALDPDVQILTLKQLEKHEGDPTARATLVKLVLSPGFALLERQEQTVLLHEMGGKNTIVSKPARAALAKALATMAQGSASEQCDRLSAFLKKQDWPDWETWKGAWDKRTSPPDSVKGPSPVANGPFRLTTGAADQYDVKYGSKIIPVFVPAGTPRKQVEALIHTMDALPNANRETIDRVVMEARDEPPSRDYSPARFDAGGGTVRAYPSGMALEPPDRRMSALVHESAHLIDSRMSTLDPKWAAKWDQAIADDIAKPSQYGKRSAAEDFAEAYLTYKLVKGTPDEKEFRAMFPTRFKLIDEVEARAAKGDFKKRD